MQIDPTTALLIVAGVLLAKKLAEWEHRGKFSIEWKRPLFWN